MNQNFNYYKEIKKKYNWGLNSFGEKLNGRIAMISILSLMIIEIFLKQGILQLVLTNL